MYNNGRFATASVNNSIPVETQMMIWSLVDNIKTQVSKVDYLQIFHLSKRKDPNGNWIQEIKHIQEIPKYSKIHKIKVESPMSEKIYVIHSESEMEGNYWTMLFASEY